MLRKLFGRLLAPDPQAAGEAERLIAEGRKAEEEGRLDDACERYRAAVAAAPRYPAAHLNLGVALEAAGDAEGALKSYQALLGFDPGNAVANYNVGKLFFLRQEFARAEDRLRLATARKPEFWEADRKSVV